MASPSRASLTLVVDRARRDVSDRELAHGLLAGEDWAVSETWHRFAPMVHMMAERALGSKSDAEDLAQDAFARLFRAVKNLRDPDSLRSFVYSCAVRALKSQLRRRQLRSWLLLRGPDTLIDLSGYSLQDVEGRDLLKRFYTLLDRLSPRDRLVFTLRRVESMTVEEIAENMAISTSTVKRSLTHANDRLARWIELDPKLSDLLDRKLRGRLE